MANQETQQCRISQGNFVSDHPETLGFDLSSGKRWIYPENFPKREYQFSIVETALFNNTLVCLPTGLGKTFIAAVVMYNFWRWYPRGRVVFLAPTRPLVAQQINACHEIMGIPSEETIELTGAINQNKRRQAWIDKRVIFATPQTFQKDLQNECAPCELIKCIVIDEAHKALGKHSYCEIVRMVNEKNKFFRVLALSATPGSKIDHVREVIQKLLIAQLELRDDSSRDIIPFTNNRSMEKIIVPLGKDLTEFRDRYINIIDPHVRVLVRNHVLQGNVANISKGRIFMITKQFESKPQKPTNYGTIMKTLNILQTMYHAYELLIKNGLRAFYQFYSNHSDKYWIREELDLKLMLENVKNYIGEFPNIQPLPDGSIPDVPENLVFGHDKFYKLQTLLVEHFRTFAERNESTRAIVFVEYRDIVNEVYMLLLQKRPLIRPQIFVGQAGLKQKQQLAALEDFRNNRVNVLISTSVGEEGLDVGEVDLIVCFDISTSAPTRLVQRMGRTGRKRNGRVVILLSEGKEVQTLNQAMSKKDSLNNKVLQSSNICSSLYQSSPRMVPADLNPECYSLFIKALPKTPKTKGRKPKASKPPAEKKPRKKKNAVVDPQEDYFYVAEPSSSKAITNNSKSLASTQSSMMKFLTENRQQNKFAISNNNDSGIMCEEFRVPIDKTNPYNDIKPHDVKLITSDSHATEFLTLRTLLKSNRENSIDRGLIINTNWIPRILLNCDIFHDLVIPSLDALDCIKNLSLYEKPEDDDKISNKSDDSLYDLSPKNGETVVYNEINNFNELSTSQYVNQQVILFPLQVQEKDNDMDSNFSGDFSMIESECVNQVKNEVKSNVHLSQLEPMDFTFNSDFESNKLEERNSNYNNIDSTERISDLSNLSAKTRGTPATIEVSFLNLLDEYTESECSETPSLLEDKTKEDNIFDDLLNQDSSEEELFSSQEQLSNLNDVTVIPNQDLDTTIKNNSSRLSVKRSASSSPLSETITKRQKISVSVDTDSESELVFGTPPKQNKNCSFNDVNDVSKQETSINYPDSDVDIFEDIEFETQCTFARVESRVPVAQQEIENEVILNNELKQDPKKILVSKENKNNMFQSSDREKVLDRNRLIFQKETSFSFLPEKINESSFQEQRVNSTNSGNCNNSHKNGLFNALNIIQSPKKEKNKNFSTKNSESAKNLAEIDLIEIDDVDFGEWNDDNHFSAIIIEKDKIEKEKHSSFFKTIPKEISIKSRSQESSTGWISSSKSFSNNSVKPLALKDLKNQKTSSLDKKSSIFSKHELKTVTKSPLSSKWRDDDVQEFQIFRNSRPNADVQECILKDNDGFAVPQVKRINTEQKINDISLIVQKPCGNKENKLPRWRDSSRHKDNSISPRFRKYHSENNLFSEKNKSRKKCKARKKISNDFIEDEAEVSSDYDTSEGSSGDDSDLGNFVSYTQDIPDETDIQAHYLRDMNNSPIRAGAFMFKEVQNHIPMHEIYSQPMTQNVNDTYLHDSFCVEEGTQEDNYDSYSSDATLEDMESTLESRRKKLKNQKYSKFKFLKEKRRAKSKKNISSPTSSSDTNNSSSDDETEALRKQVLEESMNLKNLKN